MFLTTSQSQSGKHVTLFTAGRLPQSVRAGIRELVREYHFHHVFSPCVFELKSDDILSDAVIVLSYC